MYGSGGGGHGISTRVSQAAAAEFSIHKWTGTGVILSGDRIYLQAATHGNHYVEVSSHAGAGFGVSTRATKAAEAEFSIHKWVGTGIISSGDHIYLQAATHNNHYVEVYGSAGMGFGISTRVSKEPAAEFTINRWRSGTRAL